MQESARIQTGVEGIASAYTLAQYIPNSVIQYNSSITGESLTVVLGVEWTAVSSAEDVAAANPDGTLTSVEGCTDVSPTAGEN